MNKLNLDIKNFDGKIELVQNRKWLANHTVTYFFTTTAPLSVIDAARDVQTNPLNGNQAVTLLLACDSSNPYNDKKIVNKMALANEMHNQLTLMIA